MISLFVLDIDGCISMPFETPEWEALTELRRLNDLSKTDKNIPPLSICSGRPQPYVEAVGQWLGMYRPLIFESGGGMFNPEDVSVSWPDILTDEKERQIAEIRSWVYRDIINPTAGASGEFTKRTDVGIIHTNEAEIIKMFNKVCERVAREHPNFEVHRTEISINIIMSGANKGTGLNWLARKCGISLEEIAYIGDSGGDIPALKVAGMKFTPSNGIDELKQMPGVTATKGKATRGVIEAYKTIIEANKRLA
ncbi:MAG: HAD-IIB family hydrolase [Balneolales bacterium]|nr:HAD-IIB family hydrolase [Balneolales bacterium]